MTNSDNTKTGELMPEISEEELSDLHWKAVCNGEGEHGPIVKYLAKYLREKYPNGFKISNE